MGRSQFTSLFMSVSLGVVEEGMKYEGGMLCGAMPTRHSEAMPIKPTSTIHHNIIVQ